MSYLRTLTPEEMRKHDEHVKSLYRSERLVLNIVAVLMDVKVGSSGDNEATARTKARAIVKLLERRGLVK